MQAGRHKSKYTVPEVSTLSYLKELFADSSRIIIVQDKWLEDGFA